MVIMSEKNCYSFRDSEVDEDPDFLISPCLQIGADVQLREIPATGEEYLLSVIKERQKCSVITISSKDYSKFAKNQSCFVEEVPLAQVPEKLKPTIEWQNIQVADFSEVRMYVSRMLAKKYLWPRDFKHLHFKNELTEWKYLFETREPTLSIVLGIKHTLLHWGLVFLTEMLNGVKPGETIPHNIGYWIYAILACTRQPLLSNTVSVLRNLARRCREIRSNLNLDDESSVVTVTPLNIFICLVARYFGQYDLAD